MMEVEVEEAGGKSKRNAANQRQSLCRERARGVSAGASSMQAWLMSAAPTELALEKAAAAEAKCGSCRTRSHCGEARMHDAGLNLIQNSAVSRQPRKENGFAFEKQRTRKQSIMMGTSARTW